MTNNNTLSFYNCQLILILLFFLLGAGLSLWSHHFWLLLIFRQLGVLGVPFSYTRGLFIWSCPFWYDFVVRALVTHLLCANKLFFFLLCDQAFACATYRSSQMLASLRIRLSLDISSCDKLIFFFTCAVREATHCRVRHGHLRCELAWHIYVVRHSISLCDMINLFFSRLCDQWSRVRPMIAWCDMAYLFCARDTFSYCRG